MKKYVSVDKRTKKAQKEYNAQSRVMMGFNTGTRVESTAKHPSRAKMKKDFQKMLDN